MGLATWEMFKKPVKEASRNPLGGKESKKVQLHSHKPDFLTSSMTTHHHHGGISKSSLLFHENLTRMGTIRKDLGQLSGYTHLPYPPLCCITFPPFVIAISWTKFHNFFRCECLSAQSSPLIAWLQLRIEIMQRFKMTDADIEPFFGAKANIQVIKLVEQPTGEG